MTRYPNNPRIALPDVQAGQSLLWQHGAFLVNVQAAESPVYLPATPGRSPGWLLVVIEAEHRKTGLFQADGQAGTAPRLWVC